MATNDKKGRDAVRELARKVAEHAHSAENEERRQLWRDVNSLRLPARPPVLCWPGRKAWEESLATFEVVSQDPWLVGIEQNFQRALYKCEVLRDDAVVQPWLDAVAYGSSRDEINNE